MKRFCVAIDGPSGAGKSTLSRRAAAELGFMYADTGAIYRAVALSYLKNGERLCLEDTDIKLSCEDGKVYLNGEDVSEEIRKHEVSKLASDLSALPEVRSFLLAMQRDIASSGKVIMDGRDIGTVVVPDAELKIFLTASVGDRARRRYEELLARGEDATYDKVLEDLERRDGNDASRELSPLRRAPDAVLLDTTGNTFGQSLDEVISLIRRGLKHAV